MWLKKNSLSHAFDIVKYMQLNISFDFVCYKDDVRNDLYVTLVQGEFRRGYKTSDKNVEVTMSVCNQHGKVLEVRGVNLNPSFFSSLLKV